MAFFRRLTNRPPRLRVGDDPSATIDDREQIVADHLHDIIGYQSSLTQNRNYFSSSGGKSNLLKIQDLRTLIADLSNELTSLASAAISLEKAVSKKQSGRGWGDFSEQYGEGDSDDGESEDGYDDRYY